MFAAAWADFQLNLWLYLSMPITSGVVGYVTNVIALKMMFHPLEFVGIKPPYLGWQGIVPRKAGKMASIACDTIVPGLISEREIFDRLDPQRIAEEIEAPIVQLVDQLLEELMAEYEPTLWEALPLSARAMIARRVKNDAPDVVAAVMEDFRSHVDSIFDLKDMVVTTLMRDKSLLNKIFLETGRTEFIFIERSGFFFGFVFGIVQMIGWTFFKAQWQLPLFGLLVGYATNVIALQMIFRPQKPVRILGLDIQGLFFKRQKEVSRDYGRLIADEIVTPSNIIESVLKGPYADRVFNMISRHVKKVIDDQAGLARPFVAWTIGTRRYMEIKSAAARRIVQHLPDATRKIDNYAREAMSIASTLSSRLEVLPAPEFEGMLRPAFKEDEWILIAVGAALGLMVGFGQLLLFSVLGKTSDAAASPEALGVLHVLEPLAGVLGQWPWA